MIPVKGDEIRLEGFHKLYSITFLKINLIVLCLALNTMHFIASKLQWSAFSKAEKVKRSV